MTDQLDKRETFLVQVLNDQNATLQGVVTWTSTGQKRAFRSAMELMHLMDSIQTARAEMLNTKVN